jgi:hypothetical protein
LFMHRNASRRETTESAVVGYWMTAMHVPLPLQVRGEQQPLGSVRQLPPLMTHAPASGSGMVTTCWVHCGVWLCVVMSWNGR